MAQRRRSPITPNQGHRTCGCGAVFPAYHVDQVRCSQCQRKHSYKRGKYEIECRRCGKTFHWQNKVKHCPDCRERVSVYADKSCFICGKIYAPGTGNKRFCSKACQRVAKNEKEFGWNYRKCLDRDGHACRKCGSGNDLHVHHIDSTGWFVKPEDRNNALENLIVLCGKCHQRLHQITNHTLAERYPMVVQSVLFQYLHGVVSCRGYERTMTGSTEEVVQ